MSLGGSGGDGYDEPQRESATFPENRELAADIGASKAAGDDAAKGRRASLERVADAVRLAAKGIERAVLERGGSYAREEELRGAIVSVLRGRGALVVTEGKVGVPGWSAKLGGFDFAVVETDGRVLVGETKWADGNLYECLWDILKLASATTMPRIHAAVAVYGAPVKHWQKPVMCAELFEDRDIASADMIHAFPRRWQTNLDGSTARPEALPSEVRLRFLTRLTTQVLGIAWEVRVISVTGDGPSVALEAGWPSGAPPAEPTPLPK